MTGSMAPAAARQSGVRLVVAAGRRALVALAAVVAVTHPTQASAQERNLTLTGQGSLEWEREEVRDVQEFGEVRLTLRANGAFSATVLRPNGSMLVRGTWQRPGMGNVERIALQEADREPVRGEGSLVFADRDGMIPRRLSLSWRARAGTYRLALEDRGDTGGPGRPDRPEPPGAWSAGTGARVHRSVDARAEGDGFARVSGARGGAFTQVRARLGRGGDAIIEIDEPTQGEIRGRVRSVQGRRVEVRVSAVFGYAASGTLMLQLRDADEVQRMDGDGNSARGAWAFEFRGRRLPDDWPSAGDGEWPGSGGTWKTLAGNERGRGTLMQDVGPTLELSRARVMLAEDRSGRIVLEARRERVTVEGRWAPAGYGRATFEILRINDRVASGRLGIRRDARSFSTIDGEGRTAGGRFSIVFAAR